MSFQILLKVKKKISHQARTSTHLSMNKSPKLKKAVKRRSLKEKRALSLKSQRKKRKA